MPKILILGMGGTIAGKLDSKNAFDTTHYLAGALNVESLLDSIKHKSECITQNLCNIDSIEVNDGIWLDMLNALHTGLVDSNISAIVITHGSDTLEESAFLAYLCVASACARARKSVVMCASMRPLGCISSDALGNLANAISLAEYFSKQEIGCVCVCVNDRIFSAKSVKKTHTHNLNAFSGDEVGYVLDSKVYMYRDFWSDKIMESCEFLGLSSLARVEILYAYAGDNIASIAEFLFSQGVKGVVIAGCGAGNISSANKTALKKLMQKGLIVALSTRVNKGILPLFADIDSIQIAGLDSKKNIIQCEFISTINLSPQKARILLKLTLSKNYSPRKIQECFIKCSLVN